jgi:thioredoxin-like negative regulator of GroEL
MDSESTAPDQWVICLCAEWCGVCREWRDLFEQAAADQPQARFAWVDVEDEADAMGDVDVETFPTLLVARGSDALFLGPVQPSAAQLKRLLANLLSEGGNVASAGAQAAALLKRLRATVLPKT